MSAGIVGIYKPKGPTSHDIIDQLRRITGVQRIGHAGTLDPLAEGVLVVGIGRDATKQLDEAVQKEKEYEATITLGAESTTDDAQGELRTVPISRIPARDEVERAALQFTGEIEQLPPQYSSVKVGGKPAHRRVRRGESVTLGPRQVTVKNIAMESYSWPQLKLRVVTGPGVYMRSLARDIGRALGVGGYLSALIRMRVGEYSASTALTVEQFSERFRTA
ncbi:MAG: tRNA pseudouridine(55) synthase TruB [Patescibacteria group bacterium]